MTTDSPKGPSEKAKAWAFDNVKASSVNEGIYLRNCAINAFDAGRADLKREVLAEIGGALEDAENAAGTDEEWSEDSILRELKRRVEEL